MFSDNLISLRKMRHMTQEDIAEKLGVTRQAVAKWEAGDTVPDLDKCRASFLRCPLTIWPIMNRKKTWD